MTALAFDLRFRVGATDYHSTLETAARRIAIVGPSGIGKTSLLRAVLGLDTRARGTIALNGARIDRLPVEARSVGWVPQDACLFPHLDVGENLAFAHGEVDRDRVAALVGVEALLGRDIAQLSGGERQRVAIGRALARRPNLLVLDEPVSALDRPARSVIASAIDEWRAVFDFVVLLASHDDTDVVALADEVYEMGEGGALTLRPIPETRVRG